MDVDEPKRLRQMELEELQIEMLRLERSDQYSNLASESEESQRNFIALIIVIVFTAIFSVFIFAIKRPKPCLILLVIGYVSLQFLAPVQGFELNRWAVGLFNRILGN